MQLLKTLEKIIIYTDPLYQYYIEPLLGRLTIEIQHVTLKKEIVLIIQNLNLL